MVSRLPRSTGTPEARTAFLECLQDKNLRHDVDPNTGRITVNGDLGQGVFTDHVLPENLTVDGTLYLNGSRFWTLPRGLMVEHSLFLDMSCVRKLPEDLFVLEHVSLQDSQITRLPRNFHISGSLNLVRTPLHTLPRGLRIGGNLLLRGSRVRHLPPDLYIRGEISPCSGMRDIEAYVKAHPAQLFLPFPRPGHFGMEIRERVAPFPDLLTILLAMGPTRQMSLMNDEHGAWIPVLEPIPWIQG